MLIGHILCDGDLVGGIVIENAKKNVVVKYKHEDFINKRLEKVTSFSEGNPDDTLFRGEELAKYYGLKRVKNARK